MKIEKEEKRSFDVTVVMSNEEAEQITRKLNGMNFSSGDIELYELWKKLKEILGNW